MLFTTHNIDETKTYIALINPIIFIRAPLFARIIPKFAVTTPFYTQISVMKKLNISNIRLMTNIYITGLSIPLNND